MNRSSANQDFITPENIRILKNAAVGGVKMVDSFLTNVTPHIETAIKDFFSETVSAATGMSSSTTATSAATGMSSSTTANTISNTISSKRIIKYYKKETSSCILIACEIPRVSKENCAVKLYNGILVVMAKITHNEPRFEFLSNEEYLVDIEVPKYVQQKDITAKCINGMLYVTVNTHLLDTECNINITN